MYRACLFAVAILLAASAGCSRFDIVNVGARGFDGEVDTGLIFDLETGLALDIYRPGGPAVVRPVVIFWHGGGWEGGRRFDYRFMGVELARLGFTVVIPDYRKYPEVTYPAFVEDAAATLAWTVANIAEHGGDPNRIVAMGHSAGAHTAVMLAADDRFLAARGLATSGLKGVIGLAGPYHFTPKSEKLVRLFNAPAGVHDMQAGNFVDGTEPAMVLLHGAEDAVVGRVNLDRLAAALLAKGVCHRTRIYPDKGHVGILGAFTWAYDPDPVVSDIAGHIRALAAGTLCPAGG